MKWMSLVAALLFLSGCVVVPKSTRYMADDCDVKLDYKRLKMIDLAEEANAYPTLSLFGVVSVGVTGAVSGSYMLVNNSYYGLKEEIACHKPKTKNKVS